MHSGLSIFFRKLGEKLGVLEKTEYPRSFIDSCREIDTYRPILEVVAKCILAAAQQNPKYVPYPPGTMEFEAPANQDPWELLEAELKVGHESEEKDKQDSDEIKLARKIAELHRSFQSRTRRALHAIRTFINVDFENIADERSALSKLRDELDFAKYDLKGAKTPEDTEQKKAIFADASERYQEQLTKTERMLNELPDKKEMHRKEIVKFFEALKKFYDECEKAVEIKK